MNKRTLLSFCILSLFSLPVNAQDWAAATLSPLAVQVPGTPSFKFTFEKIGTTVVNPYTVYWQLDNGSIHSVSKTNATTNWFGTVGQVKDTSMSVTLPIMGTYTLKAWIKVTGDQNASNDTVTQTINVYEAMPKKNVLLEVFKHQACGPCYDAAVYTDTLIAKNPGYAIASIYTMPSDVIYNAEGAAVNTEYGFWHPGPVFDRFQLPITDNLTSHFISGGKYKLEGYGDREQYYEPVEVYFKSASYDRGSRQLKVKVAAKAWLDLTGDLRFNVYLTEDSIKAWQALAPDPNNYYHKHVLRAMFGGSWGEAGSIPATINANQEVEYEFNYQLPWSHANLHNMRLIALVQTHNAGKYDRRILNSTQMSFYDAVSVKDGAAAGKLDIITYPNPTTDMLKVSFGTPLSKPVELSLVDIAGKTYGTQQVQGDTELNIQRLAPGTYLLRIDDGQVVHTRNIVKQ